MSAHTHLPRSAWVYPALAVFLYAATEIPGLGVGFTRTPAGLVFAAVLLVILFGTVFAAVHHAEVIAERIGEPFGTLLLTLAVTIIEVALIATIMLGESGVPTTGTRYRVRGGDDRVQRPRGHLYSGGEPALSRAGFPGHGRQRLSQRACCAGDPLTLILPNYTETTPGPVYSASQLGFVSIITIVLYAVFLYTQTIRHRDYFIAGAGEQEQDHVPAGRLLLISGLLLLVSLVGRGDARQEILAGGGRRSRRPSAPRPAFAGVVVAS